MNDYSQHIIDEAGILEGARVISVRVMETDRLSALGWMDSPIILRLMLADGSVVDAYASQDPEGNGPGTLYVDTINDNLTLSPVDPE